MANLLRNRVISGRQARITGPGSFIGFDSARFRAGIKAQTGVAFALMTLSMTVAAALPAAVDGQTLPSLAPVLERVMPAVVNVNTETRVQVSSPFSRDPFLRRFLDIPSVPRERVDRSLGSGVIVDAARGLILTNNHVIDGADDISVTLMDGRTLKAKLLGTDPDTDVAVIEVGADHDLTDLPLADSTGLRVGDFVVAVGNPFGLGQTVTSGIVSALGRKGLSGLNFQNFIQTDAPINQGNSGGALINLAGELVGINTAIFTPSGGSVGIGFAIPGSIADNVMRQLMDYGQVRRGTLGLSVQTLTEELREALELPGGTRGVIVTRVREESPAARAKLKNGDVITRIGSAEITRETDLENAEGLLIIGEEVDVGFLRDGKPRTRRVRLDLEMPRELDAGELEPRLAGIVFENLPTGVTRYEGVLIRDISRRSVGFRRGLRRGDLITAVNDEDVENLVDLRSALSGDPRRLELSLIRSGRRYTLDLSR